MPHIINEESIKQYTNPSRYPDAVVPNLQLWIKKPGQMYWIYRFKTPTGRKETSLGAYPKISLNKARELAIVANNQIDKDINPISKRKAIKQASQLRNKAPNFQEFAKVYIQKRKSEWSNPKHADQWLNTLSKHAFPVIGQMDLQDIETKHILKILNPIWETTTKTAARLRGRLERILASAYVHGYRTEMNPALWKGHLIEALTSPNKISPVKHHNALPYNELPSFIKELRECDGSSALALEFTILNANRTSEVLLAKRNEIEGAVWTIPGERMKCRKEHRVPLCNRSLEILEIVKSWDPNSEYLFSNKGKHLSSMAMLMALRRLRNNLTVHGFRSSFRDWVSEETDHSPEVAEMALAHVVGNKVEAAYRRGDLFERRKLLMQDWEKYCLTK